MKLHLLTPVVALAAAHLVHAQPAGAGRVPVEDVRVLMVAAIDSSDGIARGILAGRDANSITALFKGSGPILIDVTTIKRYAEAGCSRLRVAFSQDGVHAFAQAAPRRQKTAFGINFCRNGKPPKSLS